jgi:DNA polymerase III epsilon subunit-like protein
MLENQFKLYVLDTETTGLDPLRHEIIELSMYRINDDQQKTWYLKPRNPDFAEPDALRINGHKIEDLKHSTAESKEKYQDPAKAVIDIENFCNEDFGSSDARIMVGQKISFDLNFLQALWKQENAADTFPWGSRPHMIDTKQLQLFIDLVKKEKSEYYNLGSLVEKHGVKKLKAHRSTEDTVMTKDVFLKQLEVFKN